MDEERRRKLIIFIVNKLIRSNLRRRQMVSILLHYIGRRRRQIAHQNFLAQTEIAMRQNLTAILSYFSTRDPGIRRFWVLPRPQHWFDVLLARRDLDSEWSKHFRVNRNSFMKIVEIVRPYMTTRDNNFRDATTVERKVAAALWRLATGDAYRCVAIALGIGTTCAFNYTHQFCHVMYGKRSEFIRFPPDLTKKPESRPSLYYNNNKLLHEDKRTRRTALHVFLTHISHLVSNKSIIYACYKGIMRRRYIHGVIPCSRARYKSVDIASFSFVENHHNFSTKLFHKTHSYWYKYFLFIFFCSFLLR